MTLKSMLVYGMYRISADFQYFLDHSDSDPLRLFVNFLCHLFVAGI